MEAKRLEEETKKLETMKPETIVDSQEYQTIQITDSQVHVTYNYL
jgi:hypothetical protein